jgi:hypothetical protein
MNARLASMFLAALALAAGGFAAAAWADGSGPGSGGGSSNSGPGSGNSGPGHGSSTTSITIETDEDRGDDRTTTAPAAAPPPVSTPAAATSVRTPAPAPVTQPVAAPAPRADVPRASVVRASGAPVSHQSGRTGAKHAASPRRPAMAPPRAVSNSRLRAATRSPHVTTRVAPRHKLAPATDEVALAVRHDDPPPSAATRLFTEPLARWIAFVALGAVVLIGLLLGAGVWAKRRVMKI